MKEAISIIVIALLFYKYGTWIIEMQEAKNARRIKANGYFKSNHVNNLTTDKTEPSCKQKAS